MAYTYAPLVGNGWKFPSVGGGFTTANQDPNNPTATATPSTTGGGVTPWSWDKLGALAGKVKNPMAKLLYGDLQDAMNGPDLYSENDIRNRGLGIATSALPAWNQFKKQEEQSAAAQGMGDSGFYNDYMNRASASNDANVNAQVVDAANQMGQANQDFRQNKLNNTMQLMSMWLQGKRKNRLAAMQLANAYGGVRGSASGLSQFDVARAVGLPYLHI